MDFRRYKKVKLVKNNAGKKLTKFELEKFNEFLVWFNDNLDNSKIKLFYRGTTKSELKERIKKKYVLEKDNPWMNYLFRIGEKSKSYKIRETEENDSKEDFLNSIQDLSEKTFQYIFNKIKEIIQNKENNVVANFNTNNPSFKEYFETKSNLADFISTTGKINYLDKFKVRNYYLRLIHTIYKLGERNEYSCFVSTTTEESEANGFATKEGGIIILYWLPEPIDRFGLSLANIHKMAELIGNLNLPMYFNEFYPKVYEFSVLGGLFRNHIIGYFDKEKLVISQHLLNQISFNETMIEEGFQIDDLDKHKTAIDKFSNYKTQLILYDNTFFLDR